MGSIERIIAQLQSLPPAFREQAEEYIHQLHAATRSERIEALTSTAGSLSKEEADNLELAVQERFEVVSQ